MNKANYFEYANKDQDMYFLDYFMEEECRWVRTPMTSLDEVCDYLIYLTTQGRKSPGKLRIMSEKFLDTELFSTEVNTGEKTIDFLKKINEGKEKSLTYREWFFDKRYQEGHELFVEDARVKDVA
jgi:hypothetical protein